MKAEAMVRGIHIWCSQCGHDWDAMAQDDDGWCWGTGRVNGSAS